MDFIAGQSHSLVLDVATNILVSVGAVLAHGSVALVPAYFVRRANFYLLAANKVDERVVVVNVVVHHERSLPARVARPNIKCRFFVVDVLQAHKVGLARVASGVELVLRVKVVGSRRKVCNHVYMVGVFVFVFGF